MPNVSRNDNRNNEMFENESVTNAITISVELLLNSYSALMQTRLRFQCSCAESFLLGSEQGLLSLCRACWLTASTQLLLQGATFSGFVACIAGLEAAYELLAKNARDETVRASLPSSGASSSGPRGVSSAFGAPPGDAALHGAVDAGAGAHRLPGVDSTHVL